MKRTLQQLFAYTVALFFGLVGWWWLAGVILLTLSFFGSTLPVLVVGLLLDGYYGFFHTLPVFTLSAMLWCIVIESLRPAIREYHAAPAD